LFEDNTISKYNFILYGHNLFAGGGFLRVGIQSSSNFRCWSVTTELQSCCILKLEHLFLP